MKNRPLIFTEVLHWEELSQSEQESFLRQGYQPPEGTIIHHNLDVQFVEVIETPFQPTIRDQRSS